MGHTVLPWCRLLLIADISLHSLACDFLLASLSRPCAALREGVPHGCVSPSFPQGASSLAFADAYVPVMQLSGCTTSDRQSIFVSDACWVSPLLFPPSSYL